MTKQHSTVAYQVMWNRLISVVEEQAQALVRTAFSTSVREAGDLSAGVYDTPRPDAGPGRDRHAGPCQRHGRCGRAFHPPDRAARTSSKAMSTSPTIPGRAPATCMTSPWSRPSFHNGVQVGFFACTAHVVDIGGRGFGADAATRLRGRPVPPDHEIRRARRGRRDTDPHRPRQRARARPA